jgi:hypothetical protein
VETYAALAKTNSAIWKLRDDERHTDPTWDSCVHLLLGMMMILKNDDAVQGHPEGRPQDAKSRTLVGNGWKAVLRTVPVPLLTILVACKEEFPH